MKRLTQWIEEDRAIPRVDIRRGGYEKCAMQLARYEDTGLEPDEVMELKERDTAKIPIDSDEDMGYFVCPECGTFILADDFGDHKFCLNCGQRLEWED